MQWRTSSDSALLILVVVCFITFAFVSSTASLAMAIVIEYIRLSVLIGAAGSSQLSTVG